MKNTNETGTFTIDDNGVLKNYQSTEDNQVKENVWRCVDIPEGVRVIPEWAFWGCEILERLTFPKIPSGNQHRWCRCFFQVRIASCRAAGNAGRVG